VWFVRPGDRFQGRGDVPQLCLTQPSREVLMDPSQVRPRRSPQRPASSFSQLREHDAGVTIEAISPDEPLVDEPIHHPSQTARGHQHAVGQLGHAEATIGSASQPEQDVVVGERQAMLAAEFVVEPSDNLVVRMEECLPCAELGLGQGGRHDPNCSSHTLARTSIVAI